MKNYDNYHVYYRPDRRSVTIDKLKAHRLAMKNKRRVANGLTPKKTYSEI